MVCPCLSSRGVARTAPCRVVLFRWTAPRTLKPWLTLPDPAHGRLGLVFLRLPCRVVLAVAPGAARAVLVTAPAAFNADHGAPASRSALSVPIVGAHAGGGHAAALARRPPGRGFRPPGLFILPRSGYPG